MKLKVRTNYTKDRDSIARDMIRMKYYNRQIKRGVEGAIEGRDRLLSEIRNRDTLSTIAGGVSVHQISSKMTKKQKEELREKTQFNQGLTPYGQLTDSTNILSVRRDGGDAAIKTRTPNTKRKKKKKKPKKKRK